MFYATNEPRHLSVRRRVTENKAGTLFLLRYSVLHFFLSPYNKGAKTCVFAPSVNNNTCL